MSAPSTGFQYTPLAQPKQEIRLLQVLPGNGPIELALGTYKFSEDLKYVALSYEWASEEDKKDITVNGVNVTIRWNLWEALKSLRRFQSDRSNVRLFEDDTPRFWIDAVCIDQHDEKEKGHQVAMMGRIFRCASHTIAWLGPEAEFSALAMGCMSNRELAFTVLPSLRKLFNRTYFRRLWVVQEVVLARKLHFMCGHSTVSWQTFADFWDGSATFMFTPWGRWVDRLPRQLVDIRKVLDESRDERQSPQSVLTFLLQSAHRRYCRDVHDRLYALLGLVQWDLTPMSFDIDYGMPVEELIIRIEKYINPDPAIKSYNSAFTILEAFKLQVPTEIRGRVAWYWKIMDVLHTFSNGLGTLQRLTTLKSQKLRFLIRQVICWTVAGYGINLSTFEDTKTDQTLAPTGVSIGMNFSTLDTDKSRKQDITAIWTCRIGDWLYHIELRHHPWPPHGWPDGYTMSQRESLQCRKLLGEFDENVQILRRMPTDLTELEADGSEGYREGNITLPTQVECAAHASLLARLVHDEYDVLTFPRLSSLTILQGQTCPHHEDLESFLFRTLLGGYAVKIYEKQTLDDSSSLEGALKALDIEAVGKTNSHGEPVLIKKTFTAALFKTERF
ncbi:hypothetical protein E8E11_001634 [Didymella keratinophila]|nr:hypothetical protein E8E11_001634 [Didymella keratinophila]